MLVLPVARAKLTSARPEADVETLWATPWGGLDSCAVDRYPCERRDVLHDPELGTNALQLPHFARSHDAYQACTGLCIMTPSHRHGAHAGAYCLVSHRCKCGANGWDRGISTRPLDRLLHMLSATSAPAATRSTVSSLP